MVDDAELLRSYADDRSEPAFAELVRRHVDLVYSAALRRVGGDAHLAEDVCQKVFVALARQAASLQSRRTITGWLYTTVRFAAAEVVRGERRRRAREQQVFIMHELFGDSPADPDWEKLRPVLDEAMDELNERDREALLLRFFEGRSLGEVGGKLAVSEEAARKCVDRALDRLRGLLAKRGIGSTSAAIGLLLANQTVGAAPPAVAAAVAASALATSSASGPALILFNLMSTSKVAVGVASVALAFMLGVATYEGRVRRDAEAVLNAARRGYDGSIAKRREREEIARRTELDLVRLRKDLEAVQLEEAAAQAKSAREAQAAKEAAAWNPAVEGKAFLMRHPEVRQALIESENAKLDFKYGSFYKSRGFTAEQIEQFRAIWRESLYQPWSVDVSGKSFLFGAGTDSNILSSDKMWERLQAMLGNAGALEMGRFSQNAVARGFAVQVAANLQFSDNPLTSSQADALVQVIARARSERAPGGVRLVDWDSASVDAQKILSEAQLSAFEAVRMKDTLNRAMNARVKF